MNLYKEYIEEIKNRDEVGLSALPIEDGTLLKEIIGHITDNSSDLYDESLQFFIYNVLPGTTGAAYAKANFLWEIITEQQFSADITVDFAFELLAHMRGGPSVSVLLDLALSDNEKINHKAINVLKGLVYLYEADMERIEQAYANGNKLATDLLESYAKAEFFTQLPELDNEIKVVSYVAAEGDISTDLMSPGNQAHSRADRELHGKCFLSEKCCFHRYSIINVKKRSSD